MTKVKNQSLHMRKNFWPNIRIRNSLKILLFFIYKIHRNVKLVILYFILIYNF